MIGILIITITALMLGIILVSVDNKDSKDDKILQCLPGINCGACGFGSCKGMVEAIKKDKDSYLKCRPLRGEKKETLEKFLNNLNH